MNNIGDIIDGKYKITSLCNSNGGMGTIFFVSHINSPTTTLALKYCNYASGEMRDRFRREVRIMQQFSNNAYVAPILDANLECNPPYYVMPLFENGDLTRQAEHIRNDLKIAEAYFNRMIDCIEQLHIKNVFHRDIKPQNFLVGNGTMVVSDLGLCTEQNSATAFTSSSVWAGTPGYMPPEFHNGGFRHADATTDIFMLGVTFREILSPRNVHPAPQQIPNALNVVIARACAHDKNQRYQSMAALRQSLSLAFDLTLGRVVGSSGVLSTLQSILDRWETTGHSDLTEVTDLINELMLLPTSDQERVCMDLPEEFFRAIATTPLPPGQLSRLINSYSIMVENTDYGWGFAEDIATNMKILFNSHLSFIPDKSEALKSAIIASVRQNRYAAMDTCKEMIISIKDDELAQRVFEVMIDNQSYFMESIDPLICKSKIIQSAIQRIKENSAITSQNKASLNPFPL